jgi:hypothetical protein
MGRVQPSPVTTKPVEKTEQVKPLPVMPEPAVALYNLDGDSQKAVKKSFPKKTPQFMEITVRPCGVSVATGWVAKDEILPIQEIIPTPVLPLPKPEEKVKNAVSGTVLKKGDLVEATIMPPSGKPWNPDNDNRVVRWFGTAWKCDGDYELVNYCLFPTHMELELRRS